jgi:predicted dehydrogenase
MLQRAELDALLIATPSHFHFEHARQALHAGIHVLVEKPMCMTSAEAQALVSLADARGLVLMAGHTFLYSDLVHEVKRRIDTGELGDVLYLYSQRLNLGRVRHDVDALWNFAPHDISIASFLLDAWPQTVNARGASLLPSGNGNADVAFFQMEFGGGCFMGGHVSWLDPQKSRRMVVVGTEKMLVYDDVDSQRHIQIYDKSVAVEFQSAFADFSEFKTRIRAGDLVIPCVRTTEPLSQEIEHFVRCIEGRETPRTDGKHGAMVVAVLEAMSESMARGGERIVVGKERPRGAVVSEKSAASLASGLTPPRAPQTIAPTRPARWGAARAPWLP